MIQSNTPVSPVASRRRGRWVESLLDPDVSRLWAEMHRLVSRHPLVRHARLLVEEGDRDGYSDLTQELFVRLLSKGRFQHYLDAGMTDAEIECEIGQLELTNILKAELRKRHPESFRLASRISGIVQTSGNFRRFDSNGEGRHCSLANQVYGLSEWPDEKQRLSLTTQELEQRVQMVSVRRRDTRMVGRTGDSQLIISNPDLEKLIISVLEAAGAPVELRTLRYLVMLRLPVLDIYLVPLGGGEQDNHHEPKDGGDNPEQWLVRRDSERLADAHVEKFLRNLHASVRGKAKQYQCVLDILWHYYLSGNQNTQIAVAAMLGVSDSLVSSHRRRIEQALRKLAFNEIEEARCFEAALRQRVRIAAGAADGQ